MTRRVHKRHKDEASYRWPLRKIVEEFSEQKGLIEIAMERLECGHAIRRKSDLFGVTNAYKRRCQQCYAEAEAKRATNGMTVGELQGWFEDNVHIPGGLKSTDRLVINDQYHISIIRDGQRIGFINFETKQIEAV